jgi:alkylation response protein AidB-like acyl-CoA dehydrogenase
MDLAAFRAAAVAWLDANAARRTVDTRELKRRLAKPARTPADEQADLARARDWQRRIHDAGYAGLAVPTEYGGRGLTPAYERIWREELARYAIDFTGLGLGATLAVPTILAHGSEEQKLRFIPPVLRGAAIWCQLFSEPSAGSDLAGLTTRAERDGDEWVVNGQKVWNSYAHLADRGMLLARTDWDVPKHRGISYFLVDMRTPGVEVRPLRQITGVAHFNETFLTDVRIPAGDVLGPVGGGWGVAQTTLMNERSAIGGGAGYGGIGWDDWVALARHHGRTDDPAVRQDLARVYTRLAVLRWLGQRARAAARDGRSPGAESSVAKLMASRHAALNGDLALAISGASALLLGDDAHEEGFWQQLFLDQWSLRIGGGTEQIQRNVLGERVLGLPAEARPDKSAPFRDIARNT